MKNDKPKENFNNKLDTLLKADSRFVDKEGNLIKSEVVDKAWKFDEDLINLLFFAKTKEVKGKFFKQIKESWIFNVVLFVDFVKDKHFLVDSHTKFGNKIGLTLGGKHLKQNSDVALVWPFKDCVLEGGMSNEDAKRKEIFFNEILAQDEIDRLLHPKVLTKGKRFSHGKKQSGNKLKLTRDNDGLIQDNLIIKGNNLLALHSLKEQFAGKIKLIYIDPPYNTGSDGFKYNDNFSHSTWLTFMKNRLEVARDLLRNDGVIFVQCDDNEQAYLKVLMDEIFGRDDFVADFIWKKKNGGGNDSKYVVTEHETIIVFSKNIKSLNEWYELHDQKYLKRYREEDEKGRYFWDTFARPGLRSPLNYDIDTPDGKKINGDWIWSKKRFLEEKENGEIKFERNSNQGWTVFFKQRLNKLGKKTRSLILEKGNSSVGTNEISKLFGKRVFATPKPEMLLQHLIYIATKKGDIVLDYHLGSGTTAAVSHKMGRQYIGIEQMDYIESVAVERLKKVIAGEQGGISESLNWQGGGEFVYLELKRYNQEFIDRIQDAKTPSALEKIWKEMQDKSFLNWGVDSNNENSAFKEWAEMSIEGKQKALISLLDKNQLYVNLSEIEDEDFGCTDDEKELSKQFYGKSGK